MGAEIDIVLDNSLGSNPAEQRIGVCSTRWVWGNWWAGSAGRQNRSSASELSAVPKFEDTEATWRML